MTTFIAGESAALRPGQFVWIGPQRGEVIKVRRDGTVKVDLAAIGGGVIDHVEPERLTAEVPS